MHARNIIATSLIVAIAWPQSCLDAIARQSDTPVEYVVEGPSPQWAANALVAFGPKAKPALKSLVQATRSGQIYVQTSSIKAIGSIGPEAVEALPRLRELMKEKHGEPRAKSATAIWKISHEYDATLELIQDLEIDDGQLSYTIEAIGEIGSLAKEAIPILQKQLTNQDQFVRKASFARRAYLHGRVLNPFYLNDCLG